VNAVGNPDIGKIYSKLKKYPNVVGVAYGEVFKDGKPTGELGIVVYVTKKLPPEKLLPNQILPRQIGGVRVDVQEVGLFKALPAERRSTENPRTWRWRPAPAGVSIGHYRITAGTLGYLVYDAKTGEPLILSNNHVLANENRAEKGDPILQPGPYDGGRVDRDTIGYLERFVPIRFPWESECPLSKAVVGLLNFISEALGRKTRFQAVVQVANTVDAAVAKPISEDAVTRKILEGPDEIVDHAEEYEVGTKVCKSGRTTGVTCGVVSAVNAYVNVGYSGGTAIFRDQLIIRPENPGETICLGGDSGSLVYTREAPVAYGLLFAGSENGTLLVANKISNVVRELNITFAP